MSKEMPYIEYALAKMYRMGLPFKETLSLSPLDLFAPAMCEPDPVHYVVSSKSPPTVTLPTKSWYDFDSKIRIIFNR